MGKEQIEKLLKILNNDLEREQTEDIIGEIFDDRSEQIYFELMQNKKYTKNEKKANEVERKIERKFEKISEDKTEIVHLLAEYTDAIDENSHKYGQIMYKYGVCDALSIILAAISEVKIERS